MAERNTSTSDTLSGRLTICGGRYDVMLGTRLPDYDTPGAKAYAITVNRGGGSLFALAPDLDCLPRFDVAHKAVNVSTPGVVRYLEHDIVPWPEGSQQRPLLIFEKPSGLPLFRSLQDERPAQLDDLAFKQLTESLHNNLRDIHKAGLTHGRINPTNLFGSEVSSFLQLGDYLSAPPGLHQLYAFETIERMMATPAGRGPAQIADDIYAMGATLLVLMLGRLPAASLSPAELLAAKIEKGSLMALLNGAKLPSAYSEIMRGLLADEPKIRWTLEDVSHWLGGRRLGSKPAPPIKKAQRTIEFNGKGYINLRTLLAAMSQKTEAAHKLIEDLSLDRWLRRSLDDEEAAQILGEAVSGATAIQKGGSAVERVITRVCIALDPRAPIRFRDLAVMPEGLGNVMASLYLRNISVRNIADLIQSQFINFWATQQLEYTGENLAIQQQFDGVRMLLERGSFGFGMERALYELNQHMPCISPLVFSHYPTTTKALLEALEASASQLAASEKDKEPMDRHIAAFVLVHQRRLNDRFFVMLTPAIPAGQRAVAILNILSDVQRRSGAANLPNLAAWLARLLTPAMERFHRKATREKVLQDLGRLAKKGNLSDMLALVDGDDTLKKDEEDFQTARREFAYWEHHSKELVEGEKRREAKILNQGRQITAFAACFIAMVSAVLVVFWMVI